ncbi:MAG: hypothetical protein KDD70_02545 [Bdellovibrionales bacterium]|nr:hypothetical protein [Bdellovibrionales bacterium]
MTRIVLAIGYLLVVAVLFAKIYHNLPLTRGVDPTKTRDVFFIYTDASTLAEGKNPYQRIEGKDGKSNEKYTFYLPGFLWMAAGSIRLFELNSYEDWMKRWIPISFVVHVLIGLILFFYSYNRWGVWSGILGSSFWWFSRWPLALLRSGQIDNVAILFFVLALVLVERKRLLGLVALGASLSVKQMAAFTVPLFLVWPILEGRLNTRALWNFSKQILVLGGVPLLVSLPFLLWDLESFFQMLMFPLTRDPSGPRSVEYFLGEVSLLGKVPFFTLIGICYWYFVREGEYLFPSILFVLLLFLGFNPVFFSRYFCWAIPVVPLAVFECIEKARELGRFKSKYS